VALDATSVSSDGRISPNIGDVRVAGMSPDCAREVIRERFLKVIPPALVKLRARPGLPNAGSVVGGMGSLRTVPLTGRDSTILNVLAWAGGVEVSLNNP
jgi:polysaccharide export outer membrane protein